MAVADLFKVSIPAVVVAAAISAFGGYIARPTDNSAELLRLQREQTAVLSAMRQAHETDAISQRLGAVENDIRDIRASVQSLQAQRRP